MEITTLSELWKSPEWKEASAKFIDGKTCAWCGAKQGDIYTDSKGKERKIGLSPHHIEKHKWGLSLYNQVKNKLFSEYWRKKTHAPLFMYPPGISKKEYREQSKAQWEHMHREFIKEEFEKEKHRILGEYINLSEDRIVVLCNRCHYAREKGMILCKTCGKGYHKPKYNQCWSCSQEKQKKRIAMDPMGSINSKCKRTET